MSQFKPSCPICHSTNIRKMNADEYLCVDGLHNNTHVGKSGQTIFSEYEILYADQLRQWSDQGKLLRKKGTLL